MSVTATASSERKLDPRNLIDRHAEQELFREIVTCESEARMLTICDAGGRGKSSLLRRLGYNCDYELSPSVPCCLLELDSLEPSPFGFASKLAKGFKVRGEKVQDQFQEFNVLLAALTRRDFTPFDDGRSLSAPVARALSTAGISGTATATQVPGGKNVGVEVNVEKMELSQAEFTPDQEQRARDMCVDALFNDLRRITAERPMVLLLDVWERCNLELREWIWDQVLANYLVHPDEDKRPLKLSVIIAGRPFEPGKTNHGLREDEFRPLFGSDEEFEAATRSIKSLSKWESRHVREFMIINGRPEPTGAEVDFIREKLEQGWSLERILSVIALLSS